MKKLTEAEETRMMKLVFDLMSDDGEIPVSEVLQRIKILYSSALMMAMKACKTDTGRRDLLIGFAGSNGITFDSLYEESGLHHD